MFILPDSSQAVKPWVVAIEATEAVRLSLGEDQRKHQGRTKHPTRDEDEEHSIEGLPAYRLMPLEVGRELFSEAMLSIFLFLRDLLTLLSFEAMPKEGVEDPR